MAGSVGFNCTLSVGALTVGKAKDVEPEASASEIDSTTRDDAGWKTFEQGLKEWGASIGQLWVPTDTALQALRDAFLNGTKLAVQFLDENGYGFSGTCIVTGFRFGQPLDGAVEMPVTVKGDGALAVVTGSS